MAAVWLACLAALACYGAMIAGGHWGSDEYFVGGLEHRGGLAAILARVVHWSPRPVAELVTAGYLALARRAGHALVVPLLVLGWAGTVCLLAGAGRRSGERRPWLLASLLLACMLMIGRPDEFFYWPMATIAYLPAWAALAAATLHLRGGQAAGAELALLLTVAAFSVEIAAAVVLVAAASMIVLAVSRRAGRSAAWWLPAMAAGIVVCVLVHGARMAGMTEIMDRGSLLAGSWPRDLRGAIRPFLAEAFGVDGMAPAPALAIKLAVLAMLPPLAVACGGRRPLALWTAALLVGAYASIVLALHQFGTVCCVRHATFREGLYLLAGLGLVSLSPVAVPGRIRWPLLATALGALLLVRAPALDADLLLLPAQAGARQETWASARRPGDTMRFLVPPPGILSGSQSWPPRTVCVPTDRPPGYGEEAIAAFFGKRRMIVLPWNRRADPGSARCQPG